MGKEKAYPPRISNFLRTGTFILEDFASCVVKSVGYRTRRRHLGDFQPRFWDRQGGFGFESRYPIDDMMTGFGVQQDLPGNSSRTLFLLVH